MSKINLFFITFIIVLSIFQVIIFNSNSTAGANLSKLLNEIEAIEKNNDIINREIARASSIATISEKASASGLITNQHIVSLTVPLPLALSGRSSL